MTIVLIKIAAVMFALAAICAFIAKVKNRNPLVWFLWGLALGVFALGYLLVLPGE